jgi:hypothetical protein
LTSSLTQKVWISPKYSSISVKFTMTFHDDRSCNFPHGKKFRWSRGFPISRPPIFNQIASYLLLFVVTRF